MVHATPYRWKSALQVFNRRTIHVARIQLYLIASEILQDAANTTTEIQHTRRLSITAKMVSVDCRPDRHITIAARFHEAANTLAPNA
jgi:hypothetical protein